MNHVEITTNTGSSNGGMGHKKNLPSILVSLGKWKAFL